MSVWACLYTHQKTKKAKTWQDGILKVSINNKATLYDEDGKAVLDSKFLGRGFVVECDVEMEMDRFLVQVAEMKSAEDADAGGGDTAAAGRQQTRPAAAGSGAGAGMSMRFVGRRVVVKSGTSQIATADPSENENGAGGPATKSSVQISSRRSLAPSLRKRKQIAPVVNVTDDAGDDEEEEDNGRAIQLKRQKAAVNRGEHNKRGQARNQSEDEGEDDGQRGAGQRQVRSQRSVKFELAEERGEGDRMVEDTNAPRANSGFGSLFTAKPMFSSNLQSNEAVSTSSVGLASHPSGKRDLAAVIAALSGGPTNEATVAHQPMESDDAYAHDHGNHPFDEFYNSDVAQAGGGSELAFDDPGTDFYALYVQQLAFVSVHVVD